MNKTPTTETNKNLGFETSVLGEAIRRDTQARRLASVPRTSAPLFTREQKQFLGESLILIASGLALLLFLLNPGRARASAIADTAIAERVRFTHETRMDEEKNRNKRVEIIGTLNCKNTENKAQTGENSNCETVVLEEAGTGKNYILKNATGALAQFQERTQKVKVTGTAQIQTAMNREQNRNVAGQNNGDTSQAVIDVNSIDTLE